jgi:diaminopimelate decarboxylase
MITYQPKQRLLLAPVSAGYKQLGGKQTLTIGGLNVADLAAEYGTPLYLFDETTMQSSLAAYQQALARHYPGASGLTFAGKAFLNLAMAQWVARQGLWLDCTGAGEIHVTRRAGVPRGQILVHGVSKSPDDIQAALDCAGTIVVDNPSELEMVAKLYSNRQPEESPQLWLRLRPGKAVDTPHVFTQTGQEDSKFGFGLSEAIQAVRLCMQQHLPLTGIHFHQGSHFHEPSPLVPAIQITLDWIEEAASDTGWKPQHFCPGGGWGVPYHEDDLPHPPVEDYVELVARSLVAGCEQRGLPLPVLHFEPGRSLVARAGVSVYRVNSVKHTLSRRWILLDGGMADNPRPALYGTRYSALPVEQPERPSAGPAYLGGPFCESGDVLIENLEMPDLTPGELISIPVSGAYQLSMGSNYNGARKPAVVWIEGGKCRLIQKRETLDDLIRRDLPLE